MSECRHPRVRSFWWRNFVWIETIDPRYRARAICLDCKAWLPLGKANDEPEAVRVEMRAAEIAATGRPLTMDDCSPGSTADCAACGFVDNQLDAPTFVSERAGYWAGWLAREIAAHGEP